MNSVTTTRQSLYIINLDNIEDRLEIQFVPKELINSRQSTPNAVQIISRNNPLHQFSGGEESLRFQLDFYSDNVKIEEVVNKCRWLKALTYMDGENPQPNIALVYGKLFTDVYNRWLVSNISIQMTRFSKTMDPHLRDEFKIKVRKWPAVNEKLQEFKDKWLQKGGIKTYSDLGSDEPIVNRQDTYSFVPQPHILEDHFLPRQAYVDIELILDPDKQLDHYDVKGFRHPVMDKVAFANYFSNGNNFNT
jgi:hypothetical protein